MRCFSPVLALVSTLALAGFAGAQENPIEQLAQPGADLSDPAFRANVVARMRVFEDNRRQNARDRATRQGLPLRVERPNGRVEEIADFDPNGLPLYFTTQNVNAAISTGANLLRPAPYSLSGSGVVVGVWDGGSVRATHQEFGARITVKDGAASADHATHVGGTIAATGVVANARGMANAATVDSYDWNTDTVEMTAAGSAAPADGKLKLSNHSYGYISGWNYVGSPTRMWEWNGDGTNSLGFEQDFGRYNTYSRGIDVLAYGAPYYLIFQSAGNERTDNPTAGQSVALSPTGPTVAYNSAMHPGGDGNYRGGFENISFNALAKNVMTVGSATDAVVGGVRDPSMANLSTFTSWGPTDDGRIKPDVVANGDGLYSSLNGSNSSYGTYSGTSMSTPNACGSAALLIEKYGQLFPGQAMRASTLKSLLIHTADDRGNVGPDYKFGWGLINVKAAADLLIDHQTIPAKQRVTENQLTTATTSRTVSFVWDGTSPITATLCWTDPAGASTTTSDLRTARLVNNLNLKIIAPGGSEYQPFVMPFVGTWTQASMDQPATTGINNTDNVEQVRMTAPAAGTYQAVVSYTGTLTNNSQNYSLIITGSTAEPPPPPPLALASVSPASGLSSGSTTITLTGAGLRADTTVKLTKSGEPDINATNVQLVGDNVTCQVNLTGAAAGAWNVVATNPNLNPGISTLANAFTVIGALWTENFDGTVTGWSSSSSIGTNNWVVSGAAYHSAAISYFCPGPDTKSTTNLTAPSVPIPAGATNLQLKFWHKYTLQNNKDAGRLEFSVDGGTWFDVESAGSGTAFASNGYNSTITDKGKPADLGEFAGLRAWAGSSSTFIETIVNLTDTAKFAGKNFRMRWRLATDGGTASTGWYVDSIALIGGGNLTNQPPAITAAPDTSSSETQTETDPETIVYDVVRTETTNLSVAATDDAGEAALTYTWSVMSGPGSPASFSVNGSNAAKNTAIEFSAPGDYQIGVTISDALGLSTSDSVNVRVLQTASGLLVSPVNASVVVGGTQAFTASLIDQFSSPMNPQPPSFAWSASGGGTVNASGLFSATNSGGPFVVTATSGAFSNTASVTVNPASASVALGNLSQTYNGSPKPVTVTTTPAGLATTVTYNDSTTVPTDAGTYNVIATITDSNYQGSASGSLVIGKANATVSLAGLVQTFDGSPKAVTVTTTPAGLATSVTYNGSFNLPTNAGTYSIIATITDPNHQGGASGSLVIGKANATVTLAGLGQTYDGSPKAVTATTNPSGMTVQITYAGNSAAPENAGSYLVSAVIDDPNHQGSTSGTLVIGKATAVVALTGLTQTHDGSPKPVTATTTPAGLTVTVTYGGAPDAPADAGSYAVVATVVDANYQGSAMDTLVIEPSNNYASWEAAHFTEAEQTAGIAAEIADPDGDGLKNIAEYALGTDPHIFTPRPSAVRDANGLTLTFTRPANLPDVTYAAETSEGLGTWTPIALEVIATGETETVRARDPLTSGDPNKRFIRLRFERP